MHDAASLPHELAPVGYKYGITHVGEQCPCKFPCYGQWVVGGGLLSCWLCATWPAKAIKRGTVAAINNKNRRRNILWLKPYCPLVRVPVTFKLFVSVWFFFGVGGTRVKLDVRIGVGKIMVFSKMIWERRVFLYIFSNISAARFWNFRNALCLHSNLSSAWLSGVWSEWIWKYNSVENDVEFC